MIKEYYEEFKNKRIYLNVTRGLISQFEAFLLETGTPIEAAYNKIEIFTDGLSVSKQTKKNYRTRLRRYMEYVYNKNGVKVPTDEQKTIIKIGGNNNGN